MLDATLPTIVYIDHRAISAGTLISLACDTIIMSTGASIGAATPVLSGGGGEMYLLIEFPNGHFVNVGASGGWQ